MRVVLALTALCFALGMVQKNTCFQDSWQNGDNRYSQMCYSDLPYLYTGRGFVELNWPYTDDEQVRARYDVMEYPVGISYYAWARPGSTHWISGSPDLGPALRQVHREARPVRRRCQREMRLFVAVNAIGLAAVALLSAWFLAGVHRRRPWDAAIFAAVAGPGADRTGQLGPARGRARRGGAVGLVAGPTRADRSPDRAGCRDQALPAVPARRLLVICLRDRRLLRFAMALTAAAGSLVAGQPAGVPHRVGRSGTSSGRSTPSRGADLGSIWLVIQQIRDGAEPFSSPPTTSTWPPGSSSASWCLGVLLLGLLAPKTPRFAQLGFLIVAGFLLVNKVYSPQYVLWLLPLAVLARPRWRDQIIWQAGEIFYFASVWWYLGGYLAPAGGG